MQAAKTIESPLENDIPLQDTSKEIWGTKYQLKTAEGEPVDLSIKDTYWRTARALADVETENQDFWFKEFMWALENGAIPAGRIMSNAGAGKHKPATSTINCTVSGTIYDSMDNILMKNHESGMTLKAGCGIGYEFSTLRPKDAFVAGAGAKTSGPLSFMDIFDKMCFTVSSAGGRRGAQMATFDIHHPDIFDFIRAKREDGRLRQFNLSLLITEDFINAVKNDLDWKLSFPISIKETQKQAMCLSSDDIVYRPFPVTEGYMVNSEGDVACRVYKVVKAREVWDAIMTSTYDFAEPGFILIDKVNEMNNNWWCENIRATNPCGEQPLPPYGSCLLGSINLTKFVENPFTESASFDFEKYDRVVRIFTRMLDNVVEINNLPLRQQREEIISKRRHGMGILGLGSMLTMLRLKYGSKEAIELTDKINQEMAIVGYRTGVQLAKEKGMAPVLKATYTVSPKMLKQRPEMRADGYKTGDQIKGRILHARYSRFMQRLKQDSYTKLTDETLIEDMERYGCRFTHHTSIAPTGTISLSLANNASNGIEPSFAHHYSRNVIREGKKTKDKVDVFSYELLAYRHFVNHKAMPFSEDPECQLPDYFISSDEVTPKQHVDMQAAAQKWVDSSISKTANIPTEFPYDDFKDIYMYAYDKGLKGCTTFRFNPEAFQGVLVKESDLENTTYTFTLEDGSTVSAKGNDTIVYEDEEHSAANLFDALKEGTYAKY